MIASAYSKANFSTPEIAPLHSILERLSVLELFHGRTQAFKDMALSLFSYLLVAAKEAEKETDEVLILTATSGDTGKRRWKVLKMCRALTFRFLSDRWRESDAARTDAETRGR